MKRSAGVLLPVYALPSPYGIGTLGKEAYKFIDRLAMAGQSWWQMLPLGPTGFGDSPYQCSSAFAGNPYFIDLDMLIKDGLLSKEDLAGIEWGNDASRVDYGAIYNNRMNILTKAAEKGIPRDEDLMIEFRETSPWLSDYALFMSLKEYFGMREWLGWPDADIRAHRPEAVAKYKELLADRIKVYEYIQYLFYSQWDALRAYAKGKGIGIIGDIPIYVPLDSADVWSEREWFQLDEGGIPREVAGCPPDAFTPEGQLWGNPLYDWVKLHDDGYGWWIRRVAGATRMYDCIRIDHFRGLESYWAVPYGSKTAVNGRWRPGPGMDFVGVLTNWFNRTQFIAEDLGFLTEEVYNLLHDSGLPGMKVLEFAFDPSGESQYLPHRYENNSVCYVGTHDNEPVIAWRDNADEDTLNFAQSYLGLSSDEGFSWGMIRGGMSSVSDLFIAQVQDYLGLGEETRTNEPGTTVGNWQWRLRPGQLNEGVMHKLHRLTEMYGRCSKEQGE